MSLLVHSPQSNWASLHATRAALDLHYIVKNVVEGMGSTCEPKAGAVELADACKKILPIAGEFYYFLFYFLLCEEVTFLIFPLCLIS